MPKSTSRVPTADHTSIHNTNYFQQDALYACLVRSKIVDCFFEICIYFFISHAYSFIYQSERHKSLTSKWVWSLLWRKNCNGGSFVDSIWRMFGILHKNLGTIVKVSTILHQFGSSADAWRFIAHFSPHWIVWRVLLNDSRVLTVYKQTLSSALVRSSMSHFYFTMTAWCLENYLVFYHPFGQGDL